MFPVSHPIFYVHMMTIRDLIECDGGKLGIRRIRATESGLMNELKNTNVQRAADISRLLSDPPSPAPLILSKVCLCQIKLFSPAKRRQINQLIKISGIPCLALADTEAIPDDFAHYGECNHVPVFSSMHNEHLLESRLLGLLREKIDNTITVHGVLIDYAGVGILIRGASGIGKTLCAVQLVKRGYRWVADDCVEIEKNSANQLSGRPYGLVANLLELRPLGIVNAADLFDASSICHETVVAIVLELEKNTSKMGDAVISKGIQTLLGVELPFIKLAVSHDQNNLADLVDSLIGRHLKRGFKS
jgi:HPr kinase/phosphorylase